MFICNMIRFAIFQIVILIVQNVPNIKCGRIKRVVGGQEVPCGIVDLNFLLINLTNDLLDLNTEQLIVNIN